MQEIENDKTPLLNYLFAKEQGVLLIPEYEKENLLARHGARGSSFIEARRILGRPLSVKWVDDKEFVKELSEVYSQAGIKTDGIEEGLGNDPQEQSFLNSFPTASDLLDSDDDAPVIKLINGLIAEAHKVKASDIHIEPFEDKVIIRMRVDGVLKETVSLKGKVSQLLTSRIKVMARLDIAEKRVPQDGRISLSIGDRAFDVRVSTLPSRFGERTVLRILDKDQMKLDIRELGMEKKELEKFKRGLNEPNGIILVTGPTGSGKTTTLYAGLSYLNSDTRNILTVEDPVEYSLEGVGQTQVNNKVGMTFASGLKAILRQDPDIVMVGEIRDLETVEVAVQASLTGHLVLSTVHTNSAAGAITRLRDLNIEPFLLASTLKIIMAQRLLRKLCPECKTPKIISKDNANHLNVEIKDGQKIYQAKGCLFCNETGYSGRIGVHEIIEVDENIRRLIQNDVPEAEIEKEALGKNGTLLNNAMEHVFSGETTLEEVMRICRLREVGSG